MRLYENRFFNEIEYFIWRFFEYMNSRNNRTSRESLVCSSNVVLLYLDIRELVLSGAIHIEGLRITSFGG